MNLKNVERQLNNDFTIRCHRSFIVNINVIDTIAGNTNGYKLSIAGGQLFHSGFQIERKVNHSEDRAHSQCHGVAIKR